jgi:ATP-binding cassette subfamily F protein 3
MGHNAQLSFYAQHQMDDLNANGDILDELKHCGSGKTEPELRELLGCFLFKGDDVYKKIRVLSGGEKARVALAKTIISKANYLLLDEPTNHLDITSVNMLIQALNLFEGTYVLVSHDRYFIQNTANKIWEIIDGKINIFDGTYDEWMLFKKKKEEELKNSKSEIPNSKKDNSNVKEVVPQNTDNRQSTSDNFQSKEEKRLRQKFAKLEEEMNAHNAEKARLEALLADPNTYSNPTIFQKTEADYNSIQYKISAIQPEYETLFEQLMNFEY